MTHLVGILSATCATEVAFLELERAAPTLRDAIISAIGEVQGTEAGLRLVRVESEAANTIAKINADLLGATGCQ